MKEKSKQKWSRRVRWLCCFLMLTVLPMETSAAWVYSCNGSVCSPQWVPDQPQTPSQVHYRYPSQPTVRVAYESSGTEVAVVPKTTYHRGWFGTTYKHTTYQAYRVQRSSGGSSHGGYSQGSSGGYCMGSHGGYSSSGSHGGYSTGSHGSYRVVAPPAPLAEEEDAADKAPTDTSGTRKAPEETLSQDLSRAPLDPRYAVLGRAPAPPPSRYLASK